MKKKLRIYIAVVTLVVVGFSLFGFKGKSPTMRQPQIGAAVHPVTKRFLLTKNLAEAKITAESLDLQTTRLIEASSMGFMKRWMKSVNLKKLESRYSEDLTKHMQAMAFIMKMRREDAGWKKLEEFDFQNLLRRSDYLYSLTLTQKRLSNIPEDVVEAYKSERSRFGSAVVAAR